MLPVTVADCDLEPKPVEEEVMVGVTEGLMEPDSLGVKVADTGEVGDRVAAGVLVALGVAEGLSDAEKRGEWEPLGVPVCVPEGWELLDVDAEGLTVVEPLVLDVAEAHGDALTLPCAL